MKRPNLMSELPIFFQNDRIYPCIEMVMRQNGHKNCPSYPKFRPYYPEIGPFHPEFGVKWSLFGKNRQENFAAFVPILQNNI